MLIIRIIKKIYRIINFCLFVIFVNILFFYLTINRLKINKNIEKSILLLAGFGKYGGTRTYVENLLSVLKKNNFNIYFVINKNNIISDGFNLLRDKNIIYINYDYSFENPFNMLISIIHISKIIKENNIDTTIISEGDCGYYLPCILFNTKNILIEHTVLWKLDRYRKKIIKKIKSNTNIVCVSNYQKNTVIENWGKYLFNYCSVIYNSGSYDSAFVRKNKFYSKKKKIITIAHFVEYKNPEMWLSIAKILTGKYKELEFIWIGDGKEYLKYKNNINENEAIKMPGYCNYEQIKEEYENAFLYLALSKIESLGIAVIDALYAGLPAIVLKTGGLPEVVDSEKCGYVVNSEDEAIEKIEILLKDQELYLNMSKNAVKRYNMLFSKEEWEKKIISLINQR